MTIFFCLLFLTRFDYDDEREIIVRGEPRDERELIHYTSRAASRRIAKEDAVVAGRKVYVQA